MQTAGAIEAFIHGCIIWYIITDTIMMMTGMSLRKLPISLWGGDVVSFGMFCAICWCIIQLSR